MRLLLAALLLAGASSAFAQKYELPAEEPSSDDAPDPGVINNRIYVYTPVGDEIVLPIDTARSWAAVKNVGSNEAVCVNSSFPQEGTSIKRLRTEETVGWNGTQARAAIRCASEFGTYVEALSYSVPAYNDPDVEDDLNVYAVDPSPEPDPTATPSFGFPGGNREPLPPVYSPTPTPTLETLTEFYPERETDPATPTPTPTPVEIVVD